jgi:tight adherence protein B
VTLATALAGVAGACALGGAWEALSALEQAQPARIARRLLAPIGTAARSGDRPTAGERRRLTILGAGTLLAGGWTFAGPVAGILAAAGGPWAVTRLMAARRRRWQRELVADAAVIARVLADALAGGHSIRGAIIQAHQDGGLRAAAAGELRTCAAALALGQCTDVALERLAQRAAHPTYDTLVAAVLMQRDAGGDLSELLRQLADAIDEAQRVEDDARVATAQARFTARVVAGLPAGAAAVIALVAPGAMRSMVSSRPASLLLAGALACELLALAAMRVVARVGRP